MVAVIFEAFPKKGKRDEYLDLAAELRPELIKLEGFISIERFQSIANPEKILSLSFWENETSINQWRTIERHRMVQKKGRDSLFDNYRIRVADVGRDYSMTDREQAPKDSKLIYS